MKKNALLSSLLLVFSQIFSQPWDVAGNNATSGDFLGTTNAQPLQLKTTNTTTPQPIDFYTANSHRLRINENFIFGSTQMDNISGTADDSRMFFNKAKGAFRAGEVTGTYWDADSSGLRSFAAGFNTKAVGNNSAAFGNYTQASGDHTVAMGDRTQAIGTNSIAFGSQSTALGSATFN